MTRREEAERLVDIRGERTRLIKLYFPDATVNQIKSLSSQIGKFARGERDLTPNVKRFFDAHGGKPPKKLKKRKKTSNEKSPKKKKKKSPKKKKKKSPKKKKKKRAEKHKRYSAAFRCRTDSKKSYDHEFGFVFDRRMRTPEGRAERLHKQIFPEHRVIKYVVTEV